ncbi:MAG: tetratricopeptide repeat protein, partial [Saprospiraceae bacterium]|nr:tetratricopeptide repeat protein [Saprospiraceae bacterium]
KALQHYFQAYEYYEHIEVPKGKSRLLNNLAICSKELGHLPEAGKYYRESLEIKLALADSLGQARTLMNYGLLLAEQGQNEEGIDSVLRAQEIYRQLGRREDAYHCDLSLGKMMMDLGQWERAEPHLLSAHRFFSGDDRKGHELMLASSDLAQLAIAKNNWRLSDQFLQEAESIARKYGKLEDLRDILSTRSVAATEMGRSSLALETLQESYQLSDSINELTRLQLTEEMQTRFGVKEQEQQIALLNAKNEIAAIRLQTTKNRNTVLIFGLGLFALLSLIIYRLYDEVKGQKDLINVSLREKESLLKEIHHRVKNNLQVISSLLSMQSYQTKDTLVLDAVKESQNRVKTMALIHQNLYQDTDISAVDSLQYIDDLTKNLFNSYNIDQDKIELQTDIESISLDVDIMIPLGLILNELISNALKYAFRGGRSGLIEVKLQQQQKTLELTVADNGLGLPTDFSLENSSSMGMTLIQDFSRKLKANLKVLSDSGTKVILSIPFKSVK